MLERHQLEIIKNIEELGTVTKAADHMCISQSALSHALKKLEQSVGFKIWKKSGRSLVLTENGKVLRNAANKILPQFQQLESYIEAINEGFSGTLKIGIECYPCFQWLLKIVAPYLKKYPDVDVDIKNEFQFGGVQALLNNEIDLLITPDPLKNKRLSYIDVFHYEQCLIVSADHVLAERSYIEPIDLIDEILITYPIENSRLDIYTQFLSPNNLDVKQHKRIESTEMILAMVKNGRGVAVLPKWLVEQTNETGELVAVALGRQGLNKTTYIATCKDNDPTPYFSQFIEMATAQVN